MAAGPGGLRDDRFFASSYLSSSTSRGGGSEDDFSLQAVTDLCRMSFTDEGIDPGCGDGRRLTIDDSLMRPQSFHGLYQEPSVLYSNTTVGVRVGGGVAGRNCEGGRAVRGGDIGSGGGECLNGAEQLQYGLSLSVRDSTHVMNPPAYYPDVFGRAVRCVGPGICGDVTPRRVGGSTLANSATISRAIAPMYSAEEGATFGQLNKLGYSSVDVPLLPDDDAVHGNYMQMPEDLASMSSSSFVPDNMTTNCQQMFGQLTIPRISSGCTVASAAKQLDNKSITNFLSDSFPSEDMQSVEEVTGGENNRQTPANITPAGSRKVLRANRKLNKNTVSPVTVSQNSLPKPVREKPNQAKVSQYVVKCLTDFGICVVDRYLGFETGTHILGEVKKLEMMGLFRDGQLISQANDSQTIRGDKIMWVERDTKELKHIPVLIRQLDSLLDSVNGKLGAYQIKSRSKAMVACYPGHGRGYMRHVDNATQDGRCITCIYYLNKDWDAKTYGGLLRMFPVQFSGPVDVEPKFDRLLLFWSDHRSPHEVQPSFRDRYAITVWYFDSVERQRFLQQGRNYGMTENQLTPISLSCDALSADSICDNRTEIL